MAKETYRSGSHTFDEFDTTLMYDDLERIRELEQEEEKTQNNKLSFAGMMSLIAGVALMVVAIVAGVGGNLPYELMEFLAVAFQFIGFGALGYGVYKMLKLIFRKELNFPALNVYRKTRPAAKAAAATSAGEIEIERKGSYTRNKETSRPRRKARSRSSQSEKILLRSRKNRVFSGLAGGIAEYLGIPAPLVRLGLILSIFVGGAPIFIYLLLSIVIPPNYNELKS